MANEQAEGEALYYSILSELDSLPTYQDKMTVIINWFKYAALHRVEEVALGAITMRRYVAAYTTLCNNFAQNVMELPDHYVDGIAKEIAEDHEACGECDACKAAMAVSEEAKETVN